MPLFFQSPDVAQRSHMRLLDDGTRLAPLQLQFGGTQENSNALTATIFGHSIEELRTLFGAIIVSTNLITPEKVTRALNTGFLVQFMGKGAENGYEYGPLSTLVKRTVQLLKQRLQSQSSSAASNSSDHPDKVLLWMLTEKDNSKSKDHQRTHLKELLVYLAEMASQHHSHIDFQLYTKDLILFLLKNVLMISRNESPAKYQNLMEVLGLPTPQASRTQQPNLYRTQCRIAIVRHIVGDNSMDSVIKLHDARVKAFSTGHSAQEYREHSNLLPKRAQSDRLQLLWATDDFDGPKQVDLNQEVAHFTGQPLVVKPKASTVKSSTATLVAKRPIVKSDPSLAALTHTTQDTTSPPNLDDSGSSKMIATFQRLKICAQNKEEATWKDMSDMFDFFLDPRVEKALLGQSPVPSGPATFHPIRDKVSPLTVESVVFDHQQGITVTEEGLRHSFQCLYAMRNQPGFQHLKSLERADAESIHESWRSDKLFDPDMDPHVGGQKWTIEDFNIHGILGGGNFGRLLNLRNDSMSAAGKMEFFATDEYRSFCSELMEMTKVDHPNIGRVMGYFAIPWLGDRHKPICMCILQEKGLYNLRQIVSELNYPSSILTPLEKLCRVLLIMKQILSPLEVLEEANIMHRDIKPENIVFFCDSLLKLVDFGLARVYDTNGTMTNDCGTGPYIPPERKGHRHDPFSAGIVNYELMCGVHPLNKVPSDEELAKAFKIDGLDEEAAQQALDVCKGLTLYSVKGRWTAKVALAAVCNLMESLGSLPK